MKKSKTKIKTTISFVALGQRPPSRKVEQFKDKLNEFFSIIQDSQQSYETWIILVGRDGRKKYFNVYLHFKEFFQPVGYSSLTTMIITLYKLYEDRTDSLNFNKLLKEAKKLNLIKRTSNKKFSRKLLEAKKIWKKIKTLRNKLLAHKSYKLTKTKIYKMAKLKPNQIKRLIELSVKLFNALWLEVEKYPKKLDNFTNRETAKVMDALLNCMEHKNI